MKHPCGLQEENLKVEQTVFIAGIMNRGYLRDIGYLNLILVKGIHLLDHVFQDE